MHFVYQINVSNGGVPKLPIQEAEVRTNGIVGDKQRYTEIHGGPERALCLFSLQEIETLQKEGHPITPGSTGENLTLFFEPFSELQPDTCLRIGAEVVIQISSYTAPCKNIKASFVDGEFSRMSHKRFPGSARLYARVLKEGKIRVGDEVKILAQTGI